MKASKKLIGASVALVAALAVSVGSTFAWFTTNQKVTVDNIQANVTTGNSNLEVAFVYDDGVVGDFGYSLDLSSYLADALAHTKFDALTDNGALDKEVQDQAYTQAWKGNGKNGLALVDKTGEEGTASYYKTYYGEDEAEYRNTNTKDGNYIAFTVRFRTTYAGTDAKSDIGLYLTSASSVTSEAGAKSPKYFTPNAIGAGKGADGKDIVSAGGEVKAEAANAMRIAFHEAEVTSPSGEIEAGSTNGGSAGAKDTTGKAGKVWNPNAAKGWEVDYTDMNMAQLVESQITGETYDKLTGMYLNPAYTALTDLTNTTVASMAKRNTTTATEPEGDGESAAPVDNYYYADLHIVIWLEGTDADCFNTIFDHLVTISLNFELEKLDD